MLFKFQKTLLFATLGFFCSSSNNKSIFVNGIRCRKCYLPARTQRGNHPITLLLGFAVYLFVGKLRMWNWTPTARQLHTRTQSVVTNSRPSGLDAIVEANCNIKHKQCSCHFKEGGGAGRGCVGLFAQGCVHTHASGARLEASCWWR